MAEESKLAEALSEKIAETKNEVKFTDDEMGELVNIRNKYLEIQNQFGQSSLVKLRLEEKITDLNTHVDSLKAEYRDTQQTEQSFLETINKKYGDGELNPETGIFVKNTSK